MAAPPEPCIVCDGSGEVSDDVFAMTYDALLDEIVEQEKTERESRTRVALEQGVIKFRACPMCKGAAPP